MNIDNVLKKIKDIVLECGNILVNAHDDLGIQEKPGIGNIVTKYDLLIQEKLKKGLLEIVPNASFMGEENDNASDINNEYLFIVDPIDGTTNFSRNMKASAISVALLHNNEPIIGVCYNPYIDELYEAKKGQGAFLNNKKIHVSNKNLKEGIVFCGCSPYYEDLREKSLDMQKKFAMLASDYRRIGSAVLELCNIASGKAEVYYELKVMPWDHAAAGLILEEAGGVATTITGDKLQYKEETTILASNGVEDYLKYIN